MLKKILLGLFIICNSTHSFLFSNTPQKEVVRVGYVSNDDMVKDITDNFNKGYGYDILKKVEAVSNFSFEFIEIGENQLEYLENDSVDIIGLFFATEERQKNYVMSNYSLGSNYLSLSAKGHGFNPYASLEELDGKTVATYGEKGTAEHLLDDFCKKNNISINYAVYERDTYLHEEADYYLTYTGGQDMEGFSSVLNFARLPIYLMTTKNKTSLMNNIDKALETLYRDEGNFFTELFNKYFPAIHIRRDINNKELELLRSKPFVIGCETDNFPFSFINDNNELDGMYVRLFDYIADKYDFEVSYKPFSENGTYDLIFPTYKIQNENKYVTTSVVHSLDLIILMTKEKMEQFAHNYGKSSQTLRLGSIKYQNLDMHSFKESFNTVELITYDNIIDSINAIKNDKVHAITITPNEISYASARLHNKNLHIDNISGTYKIYFIVPKEKSEYANIFNIIFSKIDPGIHSYLASTCVADYIPTVTLKDLLKENIANISVVVIILIFSIIFIIMLKARKTREQKLQYFRRDTLSQLYSLNYVIDQLELLRKTASPSEYELITFDIDSFKLINNYYNYTVGTNVIKKIGEVLFELFKDTDALCSRRTSDQFFIVKRVENTITMEELYTEHLKPALLNLLGEDFYISFSFGRFIINDVTLSSDNAYINAELARKKGKTSYETTFYTFNEEMKNTLQLNIEITHNMTQALIEHSFFILLQPKIDLKTLHVGGAEALVRWRKNDGTIIPPDMFISVFEENGFISKLDYYVLEEVCLFIQKNRDSINIPRISVNLSKITVLSKNLIENLLRIISSYSVSPQEIELEVTESAITGNEKLFIEKIKSLKEAKFVVSIDDFGAGISSLNRLSKIEADVLKIDKVFFNEINNDVKNKSVIKNVIQLAKDLHMHVVAEGVEEVDQVKWLMELYCDYVQGYYFSKPLPLNEFKSLLELDKKFVIL